ncbi:MAG: GNAT family N-acetyltransferase [Candidatus Zixiibacteriota bacterium]|nr:MAG: GNAT family N-acetyltransferase [candidate division Zixibacteria bacterium]
MNIAISPITEADKEWVLQVVRNWGADFVISRGRKVFAVELDGFIATDDNGERVGLLTYEVTGDQCEIVTLDAFNKWSGIGTKLIQAIIDMLNRSSVKRLWLITTNDNTDAIRFYQKRGFTIAAVHVNAMEKSRELKPSIPLIGFYGIPIRDEIEFEMSLG